MKSFPAETDIGPILAGSYVNIFCPASVPAFPRHVHDVGTYLYHNNPCPPPPTHTHTLHQIDCINPLKPEFTIVIFIHNKPRIAITILDLEWMNIIRILSGMGVKLKSIMWNAVTSPF